MKTEIVIARYNEDLSWIKKLPKSIKITIYNKGNDDIEHSFIKLPNIGRESHTYLYHIINNYDKLADQTIFCQGDSIFHSPGFLNLIKNRKLFEPVQPLSAFYWPEGEPPYYFYNPPKHLLDETKNLWIKGSPVHVEYLDNNFVTKYPYFYSQYHYIKLVQLVKYYYNIDNVFKFFVERFRLKNVDLDDLFPVCYAGLFSVNKNVILENSVDFYNNIMSMLLYDFRFNVRYSNDYSIVNKSIKPIDWGLFLEKLWLVIFNYKKHNKHYITKKAKDFPLYNYNLSIQYNYYGKNLKNIENIIKFKLFAISCEVHLHLTIDKKICHVGFSKSIIYLGYNNKKLYKYNCLEDKKFENLLKDMSEIIVELKLFNNNLTVIVNNIKIIDYKFKHNIYKIENAKIFSIMENNKLIDLLNEDIVNRELNIF
jgi:hypothetical protein